MGPVTATEADMPAAPSDELSRLAALRAGLAAPMPEDRLWGWLGPLLVTAFGAVLRFDRLRVPRALIDDETYYDKDAWSILNHGVELTLVNNANAIIQAGHTNIFASCDGTSACGEYVVQPEVGKLLIAAGEWLFGLNSFGWRFASAVFGSLAILLTCRIARRMTRSTLLGCVAGLLMSLDGLEFVLSRTGILDIFLMFFVLAAFGCILVDRDVSRARLAELVARYPGRPAGPRPGLRTRRSLGTGCWSPGRSPSTRSAIRAPRPAGPAPRARWRGSRSCWRSARRRSGGGRCWRCCSAWAGGCCTGTGGPGRCCSACLPAGVRGFPSCTRPNFHNTRRGFSPFCIFPYRASCDSCPEPL